MMNKDTKVGGILLIFSLINFFLLIPLQIGPLGSAQTIFPLFANTLLLLVSSLLIWRSFSLKEKLNEKIFPSRSGFNKILFAIVITGIYAFTMESVGYFIMTPLCLILGMGYFKVLKRYIVLVTLIVTSGVYFLFEVAMRYPLPMGMLSGIFY